MGKAIPRIRRAPIGELNIYEVTEDELDLIARGSPTTVSFSFALALLPVSLTLLVTLTTVDIASIRLYATYVSAFFVSAIIGSICLVHWYRSHTSAKAIVARVKNRMAPSETVQEHGSA